MAAAQVKPLNKILLFFQFYYHQKSSLPIIPFRSSTRKFEVRPVGSTTFKNA
jgi:hypothetical protein